MKGIEKLNELKNELNEFGIVLPKCPPEVKKINIVIGKNGAGKSRFLKAIDKHYEGETVFCDFTRVSSRNLDGNQRDSHEYDVSLFDYGKYHPNNFQDEMQEIQYSCEEYLGRITGSAKANIDKQYIENAFNHFQNAIEDILGYQVIKNPKGGSTEKLILKKGSRKLPLEQALNEFSPGERLVFYFVIFETLHTSEKEQSILILDEPECHIHASALRKFMAFLKNSGAFSQIWVATHSLFVLPEFEFEDVIYLNDNNIVPRNAKMYKSIMDDVLGDDETKNITGFFSSLSDWMYAQFIEECFTDPDVIESVNPNDPQVEVFLKSVKDKISSGKIKILDFGGGKERLRKCLEASGNIAPFEYSICDPCCDDQRTDGIKRYKNIFDVDEKFDFVVAMNVFHEINLREWEEIFKKIKTVLKDDGYLIFEERQPLSKGEIPEGNPLGYFVFDNEELKVLFSGAVIAEIQHAVKKSITADIVLRKDLDAISVTSINEAVKHLEERSWENIKKLAPDGQEVPPDIVRKYAFYVQQYINAGRYLESRKNNRAVVRGKVLGYGQGTRVRSSQTVDKNEAGTEDRYLNAYGWVYLDFIQGHRVSTIDYDEFFKEALFRVKRSYNDLHLNNLYKQMSKKGAMYLTKLGIETYAKSSLFDSTYDFLIVCGALACVSEGNCAGDIIDVINQRKKHDDRVNYNMNIIGRELLKQKRLYTFPELFGKQE